MIGRICLQGGDEFSDACREMDRTWLERSPDGPMLIAPLACASGREYQAAGENGRAYFTDLGVEDITVAREADLHRDALVRAIVEARTVVLPGGSPKRIHKRLVGTALGGALRAHLAGGGAIMGASAGAMVLAGWMFIPDLDDDVHPGLGLVSDVLVLPHYVVDQALPMGVGRDRVGGDIAMLAVPTCSGVLFDNSPDAEALGPDDSFHLFPDGSRSAIRRP